MQVHISFDDLVCVKPCEIAGVDMVLDVVGASWTSQNLRILKREGILFIVGMRKGKFANILIGPVYTKQCSIRRMLLTTLPLCSHIPCCNFLLEESQNIRDAESESLGLKNDFSVTMILDV